MAYPAFPSTGSITRGEDGATAVFLAVDERVRAVLIVSDTVKRSAADALTQLHALVLRTLLMTGDNAFAAQAVADAVGIEKVITSLCEAGRVVAMVGDGINDGPARATADLGLAISAGTDVAIGAADIIVVREDLNAVVDSLGPVRATLSTIKGNTVWGFGYNVAAIPIAMAVPLFFMVSNSLRLRRFDAPPS